MPLPTILILHTCKEKLINSMLFHAVIALWIVYFIILEIGQFTNIFYIISSDGIFYRTSWFPLMVAPLVLIMLLNIASLIHRRRKLSKRYIIALLIYMIPLTIFVIIHAFIDIEMVLFLGVGICALSMYSLIVSDYIMQIIRQQREIAHQRASVMALQMRPHFIYNTMMSIYYLCKQDADKAQQVTLDFTSYLRKNFTAIASEELVPFKDELEHARAYLAVEQAQHEDMLYVDYDTLHTDFSVPSLTLQPLVENAVKHSLDPNGDPLHIYVRTQQTDKASAIIVENNGLDYQPSNDNEPHIAARRRRYDRKSDYSEYIVVYIAKSRRVSTDPSAFRFDFYYSNKRQKGAVKNAVIARALARGNPTKPGYNLGKLSRQSFLTMTAPCYFHSSLGWIYFLRRMDSIVISSFCSAPAVKLFRSLRI